MAEIRISGLAGLFLYEALEAAGPEPRQTFRLLFREPGYCLELGEAREEDCIGMFRDRTVLVADRGLCQQMGDSRIDGSFRGDVVTITLASVTQSGGDGDSKVLSQWKVAKRR